MSRIEDEYKKKFSNQELPKDGFDSDDLWDAISGDLDEDLPGKGNGSRKILCLLFFFLGIGFSGLYFNYTNSQEIAVQTNTEIDSEIGAKNKVNETTMKPSSQSSEKPLSKSEQTITKSKQNVTKNQSDINESKQAVTSKAIPQTKSQSTDIDEVHQLSLKQQTPSETPIKTKSTLSKTILDEAKQSATKAEANSNATNSKLENTSDNGQTTSENNPAVPASVSRTFNTQTKLQTLSYSLFQSDSTFLLDRPLTKNEDKNEGEDKNSQKSFSWELGIWGGINSTSFNYKSGSLTELADLKNQAEKSGVGGSFGLNATVVLKDRYLFSSGVEYHQLWSKFEHEGTKTFEVIREGQLVKVWVDGVSGDTLKQSYADIAVDSFSNRTVIHHNKYELIRIPIEFGFQKRTEKLVYGVSAGATLNFAINQSGKTFDKNAEIVGFDNDSSAATFKQLQLGVRLSPFVGYRVTERLTLKVLPQWNWVSNARFDETDLGVRTHQFNLNVGVGYSFE